MCDARNNVPLSARGAASRNIELGFGFTQAVFDNPELLSDIPDGAMVIFLPEDDPDQTAHNREIGLRWLDRGHDVYFRHVKPGEFRLDPGCDATGRP